MTVLAILGVFSLFRQYCSMQYGYLSVFYLEHLGEISGVHPDTISISVLTSDTLLDVSSVPALVILIQFGSYY